MGARPGQQVWQENQELHDFEAESRSPWGHKCRLSSSENYATIRAAVFAYEHESNTKKEAQASGREYSDDAFIDLRFVCRTQNCAKSRKLDFE